MFVSSRIAEGFELFVPQLTVAALVVLVVGGVVELAGISGRTRAGYWLSAAASFTALVAFTWILAKSDTVQFRLWSPAPSLDLSWRMDALGAFFGAVISLVGLCASVFAVRYSHRRQLDDGLYPLFLLSML